MTEMILLQTSEVYAALVGVLALAGVSAPSSAPRVSAPGQRLVKYFDFDERKRNNLEDVPMYWRRHEAPGFPPYAQGEFDHDVGYLAAPSFYLGIEGRSCAYHYEGLDIQVAPGSEYQIVAHVKSDDLQHARAYVSACLLDANGQRIEGTERRSSLVGGKWGAQDWQQVSIHMVGNSEVAYSIGLTLWVTQPSEWWPQARPPKHIEQHDVHAGAWFDDLAVYRLPGIGLSSSAHRRGHVYRDHEDPVVLVQTGDGRERGFEATLTVTDARGTPIQTHVVAKSDLQTQQVPIRQLPPGWYQAELTLLLNDGTTVSHTLDFLKLPPESSGGSGVFNRYGVILANPIGNDWETHRALIDQLSVRGVKVVIQGQDESPATSPQDQHKFIKQLTDSHRSVTGVLTQAYPRTTSQILAGSAPSLIDALSKADDSWQLFLANAVTRYESSLRYWQFGADARGDIFEDSRLGEVLAGVRGKMIRLTPKPILIAPWSAHHPPPAAKLPADCLSVTVPTDIPPSEIPAYLRTTFEGLGYDQIWLQVPPLPRDRYHRIPRLTDFTKRLIFAHQSGADMIFMPQPWSTDRRGAAVGTKVDELFMVYRAMASVLGSVDYIGPLNLKSGLACHAYDRGGQAVLALWDDDAPPQGRQHQLQLSGADAVTDIWGNQQPLTRRGSEHVVRLSPLPVFVHHAESWLVKFRRSLRFDPYILPSERKFHEQQLLLTNPRNEPISGTIKLEGPQGWQIRPTLVDFSAQPGQTVSRSVRLQAAPREPAGKKHIKVRITLDASLLYQFEDYIPLKLDLADMDVWADLLVEGNVVIVRHRVTNRSSDVVTLRSYVDAPMRKRQNLNIRDLQPEQSIVKTHLLQNAAELAGKVLRIGLKEEGGPGARVHDLSLTVP